MARFPGGGVGPQGPAGYPGPEGPTGPTGADGANGMNGAAGMNGMSAYEIAQAYGGFSGTEQEWLDSLKAAGYAWSVTAPNDSPDFYSSEMYFYSDIGYGAYSVGNYVRYYLKPDENPNAWVEGRISYISSTDMTLDVKSWSPEAFGMDGQPGGGWTTAPYMILIGEPGLGYVYEWSEPSYPYGPDMPEPYVGLEYIVPGRFNAFAVGDYVTFNFDPSATSDWPTITGTITSLVERGSEYEQATITVAEWSPSAAGGATPSVNNNYPPTLHLAGKSGANGDAHILQDITKAIDFSNYNSMSGQNINSGANSGKIDLFTIVKTSATSSIECEIPLNFWMLAEELNGSGS